MQNVLRCQDTCLNWPCGRASLSVGPRTIFGGAPWGWIMRCFSAIVGADDGHDGPLLVSKELHIAYL